MSLGDDREREQDAPEDLTRREGPIRIAAVDDNWLIVESLRAMVATRPGLKWVATLPSADDLVTMVQRECPDIVLLDIRMPGRSVFEVMQELRKTCPEVRIIMFTGDGSADLRQRCLQLGAWGFVTKFDSTAWLLQEIERVARGQRSPGPTPTPPPTTDGS